MSTEPFELVGSVNYAAQIAYFASTEDEGPDTLRTVEATPPATIGDAMADRAYRRLMAFVTTTPEIADRPCLAMKQRCR